MSEIRQTWKPTPRGKKCLPLYDILNRNGVEVHCERQFDWLYLPRQAEMVPREARIAESLREHCRASRMAHPRKALCEPKSLFSDKLCSARARRLEFDFYLPVHQVAIEFDERQHFTSERAVTLGQYEGLTCNFDVSRWQALCSANIRDPDPPCRDWQRAFRDAVRDIRAAQHGVRLLRIYYRDVEQVDFERSLLSTLGR